MFIDLNGLNLGKDYEIQYTWDVDAAAGLPKFFAGGPSIQGRMQAILFPGPPHSIIDVENSDVVPGNPPVHATPSGSGSIHYVARPNPFQLNQFLLSLNVNSSDGYSGNEDHNDLAGSTFFGEATFTLVPSTPLRGDWNRDGQVDFLDIPSMLDALDRFECLQSPELRHGCGARSHRRFQ